MRKQTPDNKSVRPDAVKLAPSTDPTCPPGYVDDGRWSPSRNSIGEVKGWWHPEHGFRDFIVERPEDRIRAKVDADPQVQATRKAYAAAHAEFAVAELESITAAQRAEAATVAARRAGATNTISLETGLPIITRAMRRASQAEADAIAAADEARHRRDRLGQKMIKARDDMNTIERRIRHHLRTTTGAG